MHNYEQREVQQQKKSVIWGLIRDLSLPLQRKTQDRGVEQLVARQAHNLEVACSSPASATKSNNPACHDASGVIY